MAKTDHRNLSRRERQIMDVVYRQGKASAQEVMDQMPEAPGYSTVRTLLGVLERKGFLRHERKSYHYVYYPTTPAAEMSSNMLEHVMETFFDGSAKLMVSALMDLSHDQLSEGDYDELMHLIEKTRQDGR